MDKPTCPHCAGRLEVVVQPPDTPPWLCRTCHRGWWVAELTDEARDHYRPERRDFHPHKVVRDVMRAERERAHQQGTSVREDQVPHFEPEHLRRIAGGRISTNLAAAIAEHLKGTD